MIQAKCIQKFKDKNNHIYGYRLQDKQGGTIDVKPDQLKQAIKNGQINIINLTLTSDNRLVDTTESSKPKLQIKWYLGTSEKPVYSIMEKHGKGCCKLLSEICNDNIRDINSYSMFDCISICAEKTGFDWSFFADLYDSKNEYQNEFINIYQLKNKEYIISELNKHTKNKSNNTVDKYKEALEDVKYRLDAILEMYDDMSYTEIVGRVGGDTVTYRIYRNGTVTER